MDFFDLHTHNEAADSRHSILNSNRAIEERYTSVGLHPWDITEDWEKEFLRITELAKSRNVIAIGECGIDKLKSTADIITQITVFQAHARLSEETRKPLIIHCVKGIDEITRLYKELNPTQAWIIHGFRGKPQQAQQITGCGLYISFGEHFNAESIKATPLDRMFIESDESTLPIADIYSAIAKAKGMKVEALQQSISANIKATIQF
jgi:TatD DNase family protein